MINKRNLLINSLIILFFSFLTIVLTYPVIFKMHFSFFGDPKWTFDTKGSIYSIWLTKYLWLNRIPFSFNPLIGFPFGVDLTSHPSQWGLRAPLLILSLWKDEIFSFNFFVLSGYILSAVIVYFLVIYITRSRVSGFFSGLIYSFAPYHTIKAFSHLGLSAIQWIPLFIFCLILLEEKQSYKMAVFCGISFAIAVLSSYYYGYMCIIVTVIFLLIKLICKRNGGIRLYVIAFCVAFLLIFPCIFNEFKSLVFSNNIETGYTKPYFDLFKYSARISDYFRPSEYHPVFGKINFWFIKPYLSDSRHWAERTVYLGLIPFVLALFGIFYKKVRDRIFEKLFFIFIAFVAFLFSMPPEIKVFGIPVYMPNYFMYKIFPIFRCPARFGVIVILCIAVLAGMGIKEFLSKISSKVMRAIIVGGVTCFILFEFTVIPPIRSVNLAEVPEVYNWLSSVEGNKVIVEYPFLSDLETVHNDIYLFYQRIHKKKLVNGAPSGSLGDAFRRECLYPDKIETARLLAYLGADYVIVHKDIGLDSIDKNPGVKFLRDFPEARVYKVVAKPDDLVRIFWKNFASPERWDDGSYWRWMGNDATIWTGNGPIIIQNIKCKKMINKPLTLALSPLGRGKGEGGSKKIVDIKFTILAFARERELEIYVNDALVRKLIVNTVSNPELAQKVVLDDIMLQSGENVIRFYTPQGEDRIGDVLHNDDDRRVSFAMSGFEVREVK